MLNGGTVGEFVARREPDAHQVEFSATIDENVL